MQRMKNDENGLLSIVWTLYNNFDSLFRQLYSSSKQISQLVQRRTQNEVIQRIYKLRCCVKSSLAALLLLLPMRNISSSSKQVR